MPSLTGILHIPQSSTALQPNHSEVIKWTQLQRVQAYILAQRDTAQELLGGPGQQQVCLKLDYVKFERWNNTLYY